MILRSTQNIVICGV